MQSGERQASQVSLVITVLNEVDSLPELLDSIAAQTRSPDEIVVVDGGSTDGTVAALQRWTSAHPRARILSAPGANIAIGRNLAIAHARGDVIAVTDAGVRLAPNWLASLL